MDSLDQLNERSPEQPGSSGGPVLEIENLVVHFPVRSKFLKRVVGHVLAVDGVSLEVGPGETLAVVGESGCGKSTTARTVIGLTRPTSGKIVLAGQDITHASLRQLRTHRRDMQLVFQNPYGSLNPRAKVGDIIAEPLIAYGIGDKKAIRERVADVMERMGLDAAQAKRYPHEFSGGQRQRIGIARALVLEPKLLLLDEPVSALDVSIQAQILNLLKDLQDELGLAYLMIAHDLAVVRHIAHRVAVMYLGKIVETGSAEDVFESPTHPYTKGLLSAVPIPDPKLRERTDRIVLEGDLPSPMNPPSGCRFRTRCWKPDQRCADEVPELIPRAGAAHPSACHYGTTADELEAAQRLKTQPPETLEQRA
jgi:oligopeptide/dipeptide ABC transporter ATP-binding protein